MLKNNMSVWSSTEAMCRLPGNGCSPDQCPGLPPGSVGYCGYGGYGGYGPMIPTEMVPPRYWSMLLDGTDGMLAIPSARPPLRWWGSDLHMTMCRVSGGIRIHIAPRHWGSCATGGCFVTVPRKWLTVEPRAVSLGPSLARIKNFCRANAMPCMAASLPVSQNHCDTEKLWVHWQYSLAAKRDQAGFLDRK